MRIIAGVAGGRRLQAPQGLETRPTSDKIRAAMFNILGSRVLDANVLDLFGGTGALALEAVSRGAQKALIVELSSKAADVIKRNAQAVAGDDWNGCIRIVRGDYRGVLNRLGQEGFDLVFLDPPYRMTQAYTIALEKLLQQGNLNEGCTVVLEKEVKAQIVLPDGLRVYDTRVYGETAVDYICREEDPR